MQMLLLERIADCQVHKLCAASHPSKSSEKDFSDINYCQADTMVKETKELLTAEIESTENAAEMDKLKDLWN